MPQSLMLLKRMPTENYLHDLQAKGVLRASMNFLPGGPYAGAGLYQASPSYALSAPTVSADSGCPYPDDPAACELWEIMQAVRKLSSAKPLDYNAFLFLEVERGAAAAYADEVLRMAGSDDGTGHYVETQWGKEYVAAGSLLGDGTYNMVVEVLADQHERMQKLLHGLTDLRIVRRHALGRLAGRDTRGFGEPAAPVE